MTQFRKGGWLVFLATLALSATPAWAAEDKFTGGAEVGFNITTVGLGGANTAGIHASPKAGLIIGAFAKYTFTDVLALQPEFVYSQKHLKIYDGTNPNNFQANENLDVFEIPVLLRVNAIRPSASAPGLYLVMGPAFSYKLRAHETKRIENGKSQPDNNNNSDFNKAGYSIIGGAGITKGKWDVEGRYQAGIRSLLNNGPNDDSTAREHTFTMLLRWRFK